MGLGPGTGRGWRRPGAGRPKGARNKRTVLAELLPKLEAARFPGCWTESPTKASTPRAP